MIRKYGPQSLTFPASGGNTQSYSLQANTNGVCLQAIVQMPDFTNSVTGTLSIINGDGVTLLSTSGIPKNATTVISCNVPLTDQETYTIQLALSGDPGGSGGDGTNICVC